MVLLGTTLSPALLREEDEGLIVDVDAEVEFEFEGEIGGLLVFNFAAASAADDDRVAAFTLTAEVVGLSIGAAMWGAGTAIGGL